MKDPRLETETDILSRCMVALHLFAPGAKFWRANIDMRGTYKQGFVGMSDILGMQAHGMFLAVEVKKHDGKLTEEQHDFLADVCRRGGLAAVYAPLKLGGLEDFYAFENIPQKFIPTTRRKP